MRCWTVRVDAQGRPQFYMIYQNVCYIMTATDAYHVDPAYSYYAAPDPPPTNLEPLPEPSGAQSSAERYVAIH